jgi:patatin-like phospholipase/acyl hydrolase
MSRSQLELGFHDPQTTVDGSGRGRRTFRILSLDGGGYKGMFSAAILDRLAADLQIDLTSRFDLIAGTSTGAIIALGLAAGLTPAEVLRFYVEHGPTIFPGRRLRGVRRLARSKHSPVPLAAAVQEALGERTLADSQIPLVIPAYDLCNDDVHLFRTPHAQKLLRDGRERMVDVALATTAAPTFFPAHPLRGLRLLDGGVWANNPTMIAIVEALTVFERPLQEIVVLNVGTTTDTRHRHARLDRGGIAQWAGSAAEVIMRGQSLSVSNHARLLLGAARYLRIDPKVPAGELGLDRLSTEQLLGRAERESRHICPTVSRMLAAHSP